MLVRENSSLKRQLSGKYQIGNIVSNSSRMREVFEMIHRVADSNATVLLRGESGTGKTLVAKALHYNSKRADRPFVVVNCSALPETLLESELSVMKKGPLPAPRRPRRAALSLLKGAPFFLTRLASSVRQCRSNSLMSFRIVSFSV